MGSAESAEYSAEENERFPDNFSETDEAGFDEDLCTRSWVESAEQAVLEEFMAALIDITASPPQFGARDSGDTLHLIVSSDRSLCPALMSPPPRGAEQDVTVADVPAILDDTTRLEAPTASREPASHPPPQDTSTPDLTEVAQ